MSDISGIENEYQFVKAFNNKRVNELNPMLRGFIEEIFNNIDDDSIIKCWRNHYTQKSDILIKIGNALKGVSIKMGSQNSVHVEPISSFIHFLIDNGIPRNIIIEYLKYHYADGSTNGKGLNRISVAEYKKINQNKIDLINLYFNNEELVKKCIDRFVFTGNNSKHSIDALIYGRVNDFLYLSKESINKIILAQMNKYSSGVHFSVLSVQPQTRNLNYNPLYEKKRYCVQIKWFSLFDDILLYMSGLYIK